jgi:hypothetical protein
MCLHNIHHNKTPALQGTAAQGGQRQGRPPETTWAWPFASPAPLSLPMQRRSRARWTLELLITPWMIPARRCSFVSASTTLLELLMLSEPFQQSTHTNVVCAKRRHKSRSTCLALKCASAMPGEDGRAAEEWYALPRPQGRRDFRPHHRLCDRTMARRSTPNRIEKHSA